MKTIVLLGIMTILLSALTVSSVLGSDEDKLLLRAATSGDLTQVKEALSKNANVNYADKVTWVTPIIAAALHGHLDVVKLLIEKGANIEAVSKSGVNAVMAAGLDAKNREIVKLLLSKGGMGEALFSACYDGDEEAVKGLLDAGVAPNIARADTGETPLMWAAYYGYLEIVRLLLDKGANVNAKSARGVTALMAASTHEDNLEVANLLIERGADVNAKSQSGRTALQYSAMMDEINYPGVTGRAKGAKDLVLMGPSGETQRPEVFQNEMTRLLKEHSAK